MALTPYTKAATIELSRQRHTARQHLLAALFAVLDWLERLWRRRSRPQSLVLSYDPGSVITGWQLLTSTDTQPNLERIYAKTLKDKEPVTTILPAVPQRGGRHRADELLPTSPAVVLRTGDGWARYGNGAGVLINRSDKIFS
jgi:hypothetical protein